MTFWQMIVSWLERWSKADTQPAPPEPAPLTADAIDPKTISWDEPAGDVGSWQITAKIENVKWRKDGCEATRVGGDWPLVAGKNPKMTIGNWWIICQVDGRWHGATTEWLGRGKTRVSGKRWDGTDAIHGVVGSAWRPTSGETVGIMQSTAARAGIQNGRERSQIIAVRVS